MREKDFPQFRGFKDYSKGSADEPFIPLTEEDKATDLRWKAQFGFACSELGLTWGEVEIINEPFRLPEEEMLFHIMQESDQVGFCLEEPITPREMAELSDADASKLMVARLGGKVGVSGYLKHRAGVLQTFRKFVDDSSRKWWEDKQGNNPK